MAQRAIRALPGRSSKHRNIAGFRRIAGGEGGGGGTTVMGLEERSGDALPLPLGTKVPLKHCCAEPAVQTSSQWKDQAPSAVPAARGGSDGSGRGARSQQRAAGAAAVGCGAPIPIPIPVPVPILILNPHTPNPVSPSPYLHSRIASTSSPAATFGASPNTQPLLLRSF